MRGSLGINIPAQPRQDGKLLLWLGFSLTVHLLLLWLLPGWRNAVMHFTPENGGGLVEIVESTSHPAAGIPSTAKPGAGMGLEAGKAAPTKAVALPEVQPLPAVKSRPVAATTASAQPEQEKGGKQERTRILTSKQAPEIIKTMGKQATVPSPAVSPAVLATTRPQPTPAKAGLTPALPPRENQHPLSSPLPPATTVAKVGEVASHLVAPSGVKPGTPGVSGRGQGPAHGTGETNEANPGRGGGPGAHGLTGRDMVLTNELKMSTKELQNEDITGTVTWRVRVTEKGEAVEPPIMLRTDHPLLARASRSAVEKLKFKPWPEDYSLRVTITYDGRQTRVDYQLEE